MVEELRYRYKNYNLKWIAISVVVAIVMLVASKFGIISILKGPVELSGKWNPEELEGKYVTLDVEFVFGVFAEETSTDTKTNKTTTTSLCYLGYYYDEASAYETVYGIKVSNANKDGLERLLDEFYKDDTYPSKTHKVTGTFKKMDGKILQYYNETLEDYFDAVPEDAIPYAIFDEEVNGMDITIVYILTAGAAIMFIVAIIGLIRLVAGDPDKYIKKFLDSNNKSSRSQLELEFSKGNLIGKKIVAGRKYTFYQSGGYMHVVDHTEFVWAYYYSRSGKYSQSLVRTFNINKKKLEINACKADSNALLQYYQESQPQMMVGYDKDLEKCYNKDFETFLGYCYNDAKAKQETEDLFF